MSITVNTAGPAPLSQGPVPAESQLKTVTAGAGRPEDLKGAARTGASETAPHAGGAPALPPPNLSAVDMMLHLSALMSKMTELTAAAQQESLKKDQTDLKLTQEKRMAEMQTYYEKMAESREMNTGFFTRVLRAAVSAAKGDWNTFGDQLGHAFSGNIGTVVTIGVAVAGCLTPAGPVAAVFLVFAAMEDETFTYELMCVAHEAAGGVHNPEFHETAKNTAAVMKWIGVGSKIVTSVAIGVAGAVGGIVAAPATGGASMFVIPAIVALIMGVGQSGLMVEGIVRGTRASHAQAEGWDKGAEADKTKSQTEIIMGKMKRDMAYLQDIFDNLQNLVSSLSNTISRQQEASASAAQTV